jgi:hypothetical protein
MDEKQLREHCAKSALFTFENIRRDAELLAENQPTIYSKAESKKSVWGYVVAAAAGVFLGFALKSVVGINSSGNQPGGNFPRL